MCINLFYSETEAHILDKSNRPDSLLDTFRTGLILGENPHYTLRFPSFQQI